MTIVTNAGACYGCRRCELVCSFHHESFFSPELSSIRVLRNNRTGKIELSIGSTCDLCESEKKPLCVEHCLYGALKYKGER